MIVRATSANPAVLRWAREGLGLSVEEVAERIGRPAEIVREWESGTSHPTFNQLETLANSVFKRPVAVFFFPAPPEDISIDRDFRTLPGEEIAALERDTRLALRDAHAYQLSLRELTGGRNPAGEELITRTVQRTLRSPIPELAQEVRGRLGVTLDEQYQWRSAPDAFKAWRSAVESLGVYVFKRSLEQRAVSGFCLRDDEFPVILVNNSTPHTRQIFTLFHELGHLLHGVSSITTTDLGFIDRLSGEAKAIEVRCNQFAAEFLVPERSFPWNLVDTRDLGQTCSRIADIYSVSREVILRRLKDAGQVGQAEYEALAAEWIEEAQEGRARGASGGNYYANQVAYLGESFLELGFSQYRAGNLTRGDLADHFGMRAQTVGRLEDYLIDRR